MRAFVSSDINSPNNHITALLFLHESEAIDYYHRLTSQVQDDWFGLMRVLGQRFHCISRQPVYLSRMLTLKESEFLGHADFVREF